MMNRRDLVIVLAAMAAVPRTVLAQPKRPIIIGWLHPGERAQSTAFRTFKESLAALGWKEGLNCVFEERWAEGRVDRLEPLAAELAAKKPAVVAVALVPTVAVMAKVAPGIPVVMTTGGDLVATGLAKSLSRPGGMITGVTNMVTQVSEKYLELLLDTVPRLRRIGVLIDPRNPANAAQMEAVHRSAAQRYSVQVRISEVANSEETDPAISRLAKEGAQGLIVMPSGFFTSQVQLIVKLALARRWPVIAGPQAFTREGALLSYSADSSANYRRAAHFVDRILKGAKPGDLPIEQPTKFELVINLKTAKALGLTIPQSILVRADRVIE